MADTSVLERPQSSATALPELSWSKVVVTGGFGSGKTTLIRSACTGPVFGTEEPVSALLLHDEGWTARDAASFGKTTMTAALDFARLDLPSQRRLYIYGTPGRMSFWTIWQDLCDGAHGAVIVADAEHLASSFAALDFFDSCDVPFVMVINTSTGTGLVDEPSIRDALGLPSHAPLLSGDLRDPAIARNVFLVLDGLLVSRQNPYPPTI